MHQEFTVSKALRRPWYRFWKVIRRRYYEGRPYTLHVPSGRRVFTPCYDRDSFFGHLVARVKQSGPLAVSLDRCYVLFQFSRQSLLVTGDMAECGVFTGGTANLIAEVIDSAGRADVGLHLFDSFEGMPVTTDPRRDYHRPGDFSGVSVEAVRSRLSQYQQCTLYPGFMPGTFADLDGDTSFSFVHVDVDIYPTALDCCRWFWPRLSRGGAIVFDDYGFYAYRKGIRAAVDEFFAETDEKPIVLPTGQAVVIKAAR